MEVGKLLFRLCAVVYIIMASFGRMVRIAGHTAYRRLGMGAGSSTTQSVRSSRMVHTTRGTSGISKGGGVVQAGEDPQQIPDEEWKKRLNPQQYDVTRRKGTERAFTGEYTYHYEQGIYTCACCGAELFSSKTKYDSGSGWPSFWEALAAADENEASTNVIRHEDNSLGMRRTEVLCKQCNAHLGHVFPDGPKETGERFCINSASLGFKKTEDAKKTEL